MHATEGEGEKEAEEEEKEDTAHCTSLSLANLRFSLVLIVYQERTRKDHVNQPHSVDQIQL